MPWSPEQEEAIYSKGKNLLVAAAAGSGKTSVLVERIIQHLISGYCNINEILVVTFTRAAASEMQGRIAKAISEKLDLQQREKQLILLNGASISTLHSFCQSIIRQYFYHLDLDPKARLANEQEVALLEYDVLDNLFEREYAGEGEALPEFVHFTELYGSERGDENMYKLILRLFKFAQAQPFPRQWLEALPEFYLVEDIRDSAWFKIFRDHLAEDAENCLRQLESCYGTARETASEKYMNLLDSDLVFCRELKENLFSDWDAMVKQASNIKLTRFNRDKEVDEEISEQLKNRRSNAWAAVKDWKKTYALQSLQEAEADLPLLYRQARALVGVTLAFAKEFAEAKKQKNIMDFSDLEHYALQLLTEEGSDADQLIPSSVALELQEKYKEIMVDEYQDTNGVQEAILNLVAGTEPKKFYVGDVKQSIYKFRLAEPELFLAKYQSYPEAEESKRIDLAKNFRSRREVLSGVNCIFSQLMDPALMELDYGEAEALKCGLDYPEGENTLAQPIEVHLFGEDAPYRLSQGGELQELDGYSGEVRFIVERIARLYREKPLVYDKDKKDYRPLEWRDIVILLRSVVGKGNELEEALLAAGIPVYANADTGYFQATEIELMLSLLQIIDNPQQDIPLTGVLFSVIGKFSKEELAEIKVLEPELSMYSALEKIAGLDTALGGKIREFLACLEQWRTYSRFHSVPQLLWRLYEDTGYYEYLGGLPEGTVRQANLRALYSRARDFEMTAYRGLFRFLRYVRRLQDLGTDLAVARTLGEGENVVRIMTVHKSKGLEFPVVFMPNLNKKFNLQDAREQILIHKNLGLGMYLQGENVAYETLAHQAVAIAINREAKAEEARVLYVGMTRAREKLIMSASGLSQSKLNKLLTPAYYSEALLLPKAVIGGGAAFLDWILPGLARHPDAEGLAKIAELAPQPVFKLAEDSRWQIEWGGEGMLQEEDKTAPAEDFWQRIGNLQPVPQAENTEWVAQRLSWSYPRLAQQAIPAKLTVTEIKQRFMEGSFEEDEQFRLQEFAKPKFLQQEERLSGMEYGTLVHRILQHLDLQGDLSASGIGRQVEALREQHILPKEQGVFLPYKKLAAFFTSPIGKRLLQSETVEREMHFNKLLPADLFYQVGADAPDIFLQGVIDLLFEEADGWVLVDYKTDNIDGARALERYALQLQLYSKVAGDILSKPVKASYLYMIATGEFQEVPKADLSKLNFASLQQA